MSLKSYWSRSPKLVSPVSAIDNATHIRVRDWMANGKKTTSDEPSGRSLCQLIEADNVLDNSFTLITIAAKAGWCIDDISCRKCLDVWSLVYEPS